MPVLEKGEIYPCHQSPFGDGDIRVDNPLLIR